MSILDRPASGEVGLLSIIPIIHALPFLSYENVDILHFKCLINIPGDIKDRRFPLLVLPGNIDKKGEKSGEKTDTTAVR